MTNVNRRTSVTDMVQLPMPLLLGTDFMLRHNIVLTTTLAPSTPSRVWELQIDGRLIPIMPVGTNGVEVVRIGDLNPTPSV